MPGLITSRTFIPSLDLSAHARMAMSRSVTMPIKRSPSNTGWMKSPRSSFLLPSAAALALSLLRYLPARASRFGEADRDRLLAARHLFSGASGLQGAALPLMHRLFDLGLRLFSVLRHSSLLC